MFENTDDHSGRAIPQFTGTIPGQRRDGTPGAGGGRPFGPPPGDDTIPGQADGTHQ